MFNKAVWKEGEKKTVEYMKERGYNVLYTNFSCVGVELDIVATLPANEQQEELSDELKNANLSKEDKKKLKLLKKSRKELSKNANTLLIITEVKARSNEHFGKGKESLSSLKKIHLQRGAEFLLRQKEFAGMQVRFDISSVDGDKIEYIENGFIPE